MIYIKCEGCGKLFSPKRMNTKYCSISCRNKKYYKSKPKREPKYYSKLRGKYSVQKHIDYRTYFFGMYDTEEEAQKVVEHLKQHNWERSSLDKLKL